MIEEIFTNTDVTSLYDDIINKSGQNGLDPELKNNILLTMLKLFFRVRAFSLSRKIVAKHKEELQAKRAEKASKKALRKTLKDKTDKSKVDFSKD